MYAYNTARANVPLAAVHRRAIGRTSSRPVLVLPRRPFSWRGLSGLAGLAGLSVQSVYNLARNAGFPSEVARQMVAIAQRESSLEPSARCLNCLKDANGKPIEEDSIGLWQINMNPKWAAQRRALFGISSNEQLLNPATNAAAAYKLWGGSAANLASVWAIDRDGTFPWRTRYLGFLNQLPAASSLESAYSGSSGGGGEVACAQVMKTCPDGSTVGYKPGTCEYLPCPEEFTGPCAYCRGDLVCLAGCTIFGPSDDSTPSGGGSGADPAADAAKVQQQFIMAAAVGVGLALVLWAVES